MSTPYTPSSWTFSRTTTYWKICHPSLSTLKGPKVLAMVHHRNPNAEHDARLMAAAPDLLEALQSMVDGDSEAIEQAEALGVPFPAEMLTAYIKARAAIAKALGEKND